MKLRIFNKLFSLMGMFPLLRNSLFIALMIFFSGFSVYSQTIITVRFANPTYSCSDQTYCVDVEFQSNIPDLRLYEMNVRFFFETAKLEYQSMTNFVNGYAKVNPDPPEFNSGDGTPWSIAGGETSITYVNGAMRLTNPGAPEVLLPISTDPEPWMRLYSFCFKVRQPDSFSEAGFCPSLIWSKQLDPTLGGFGGFDDGVSITYYLKGTTQNAISCLEHVVQYNWVYYGSLDVPYGYPSPTLGGCVYPPTTDCSGILIR